MVLPKNWMAKHRQGPSTIISLNVEMDKDFVVNDGVTEDLARKIHSDPTSFACWQTCCRRSNQLMNDNGDGEESPPARRQFCSSRWMHQHFLMEIQASH